MKKVILIAILLVISVISISYAQQMDPYYLGSIRYYNYIIPTYISVGYDLSFVRSSICLSRYDRPDISSVEHLGSSANGTLSEFYIKGKIGQVNARYYHMIPKIHSGSGLLTESQYKITLTSSSSGSSSTSTADVNLDGRVAVNRVELGIPLFIPRSKTIIEPFFVTEWIKKDFNLTLNGKTVDKDKLKEILDLGGRFNSGDNSFSGIGLMWNQGISRTNDLTVKFFKTFSSSSNNTFFDIKTDYYFDPQPRRRVPAMFLGVGYTYRYHGIGSSSGTLQINSKGPYFELGCNF